MAAVDLELFPDSPLHICFYTELVNASELKEHVTEYEFALVNPAFICSIQHVLSAANRAVANRAAGHMKTRALKTELLYYLSPSNNIKETLQRYSIQVESQAILVVAFSAEHLQTAHQAIQGRCEGSFDKLADYSDQKAIRQIFKIQDPELETDPSLTNAVLSRLALKDFK
mmetsp:Transcript_25643/g.44874  ORF Transcript_25643/g.44874 Transcript_25643/m.44874 type:complete len:171 (-) Transcript_25643:4730-5242(-)